MPAKTAAVVPTAIEEPPKGFRVNRTVAVGRHPLLEVFPGLDKLSTAARHEPDAKKRRRLHDATFVEVVDEDMWMYVAPRELPKSFRRRWKPVVSGEADCIVVGASHLRESPALTLFLDIFHELRHIQQRRDGHELWPEGLSYVERPTEIDAYQFVVDEARRLRVADETIREYLKVEWVDDKDLRTLYQRLGVPGS